MLWYLFCGYMFMSFITMFLSNFWAAAPWILAGGAVFVFLKGFFGRDGDEPDALEGDKDEEEKDERAGARKLVEKHSPWTAPCLPMPPRPVSDSSSSDEPNDINNKTIAEIRVMIGSWESYDSRWNLLEQDSRSGARKLARRRSASSNIKNHAKEEKPSD